MISLYILAAGAWIFAAGCAAGDRVTAEAMNRARTYAFYLSIVAAISEIAMRFWG